MEKDFFFIRRSREDIRNELINMKILGEIVNEGKKKYGTSK